MLQQFERFTLVEEEQTTAPWMHLDAKLRCPDGRKKVEKVWVDVGLLIFIRVRYRISFRHHLSSSHRGDCASDMRGQRADVELI